MRSFVLLSGDQSVKAPSHTFRSLDNGYWICAHLYELRLGLLRYVPSFPWCSKSSSSDSSRYLGALHGQCSTTNKGGISPAHHGLFRSSPHFWVYCFGLYGFDPLQSQSRMGHDHFAFCLHTRNHLVRHSSRGSDLLGPNICWVAHYSMVSGLSVSGMKMRARSTDSGS
jgi:hypothetical protein